MNLHGSIRDLQSKMVQLYLKLEKRFSENLLIRELWTAMANDVSEQIRSLNALPQSFWNQLNKDQDLALIAAAESASHQDIENEEDQSLKGCFSQALRFEEPAVLKVYAPLTRKLRENSSAPALDFYIMLKAHLARIMRVTQSFAGDPVITQRANALLQAFEKEIQEPKMAARVPEKKKNAPAGKSAMRKEPAKGGRKAPAKARPLTKPAKARPSTKPAKARPLTRPAKVLHRHAKPLVKKAGIARRRARR